MDIRKPTIVLPYIPPDFDGKSQDVFVYLRPESNGIATESVIMRSIAEDKDLAKHVELVYLANIPGEWVHANKIIEKHYYHKLYFARLGKAAFTSYMNRMFEYYFGHPPAECRVYGAFSALRLLGMSAEQLFGTWVPEEDMLVVDGQSVKKVGDIYVVNYDIPALIEKYNAGTDMAVMVFRSDLPYRAFRMLIESMGQHLRSAGVFGPKTPISRVFHYSKGPFEQVQDAMGYLYDADSRRVPLEAQAFSQYLLGRGVSLLMLRMALKYPIMRFDLGGGVVVEEDIYSFTVDDSYEEAGRKLESAVSQLILR